MSDYETLYYETLSELETATSELAKYKKDEAQLRVDLAEREAACLKYWNALKTVMANAPEPYCAITRAVDAQVREALSTPPSTSYLEQWITDNFKVAAFEWRVTYATGGYTRHLCYDRVEAEGWNEATLTDGVVTPLYTRKEKR